MQGVVVFPSLRESILCRCFLGRLPHANGNLWGTGWMENLVHLSVLKWSMLYPLFGLGGCLFHWRGPWDMEGVQTNPTPSDEKLPLRVRGCSLHLHRHTKFLPRRRTVGAWTGLLFGAKGALCVELQMHASPPGPRVHLLGWGWSEVAGAMGWRAVEALELGHIRALWTCDCPHVGVTVNEMSKKFLLGSVRKPPLFPTQPIAR